MKKFDKFSEIGGMKVFLKISRNSFTLKLNLYKFSPKIFENEKILLNIIFRDLSNKF